MTHQKALNLVLDYLSKYQGTKSSSAIAQLMLEEVPDLRSKYNIQTLGLLIYEQMNDQQDEALAQETIPCKVENEEDKYEIVDDEYIWESKKAGTIKIKIEDADRMFYEYSSYGLDMTQEQVRNKHGLSIPAWNSIKSTLWLYKKSNIFSPYTAANTDAGRMKEMIQDKLDMKHNDKKRLIEEEYRNHTLKIYKKVIKENLPLRI
jgi:hypothetical protein